MPRLVGSHVLLAAGAVVAAGGMLLVHYGRTSSKPPYSGIAGSFRVVTHPYAGAGIAVLVVGLVTTIFGIVVVIWRARPR